MFPWVRTIVEGDGKNLRIMAHPPLKTSDLSLEEFIDTIIRSGTSKEIKLDFKDTEAVHPSLEIIKSRNTKLAAFSSYLQAELCQHNF